MTHVLKFGGTSLASPAKVRAAADIVRDAAGDGATVVIVSAMGSATDDLLGLAAELGESSPSRETDQLIGTGEVVAAAALAIALRGAGCDSVSLSAAQAGIRAEGTPSEGRITGIDAALIRRHLAAGRVPVIAGFQGWSASGDIVTLGRGGSDTTAVAIAAALGATQCVIYTDVDGIHSADPRLVGGTAIRRQVPSAVMAEMAVSGARVLHPRAVDLARARNVRIKLRNSSDAAADGTSIGIADDASEDLAPTAITHDDDVARVLVKGAPASSEQLSVRVLQVLGDVRAPIDLVARSGAAEAEFRMGFTMRESDLARVGPLLESVVRADGALLAVDCQVSKVSLVGHGLSARPDLTAQFLGRVSRLGVPVSWISTTAMRISAVVPRDRVRDVVEALHAEFDLAGSPPATLVGGAHA
jgi:aspartate kinase